MAYLGLHSNPAVSTAGVYELTLTADPRTGSGRAAPIGTLGSFSGVVYEKWGTGNTQWCVLDLPDDRTSGLLRAQQLLGTSNLEELIWEPYGPAIRADITTGALGATGSRTQNVDGTNTFATGVGAGGYAQTYWGTTGNPNVGAWYARARVSLGEAVGVNTYSVLTWTSGGNRVMGIGAVGTADPVGNATNFVLISNAGADAVWDAATASSVAFNTSKHVLEMWGVDGTIRGGVDFETALVPGSAINAAAGSQPAIITYNGAGGNNYSLIADYFQFIVRRAA